MGMMDAVRSVFSKYVTFSGRASRSEFWWFYLFSTLVSLGLTVVDGAVFGYSMTEPGSIAPLQSVWSLAVLLPTLAVGCRRLHDIGKSGWWWLIILVPLVGIILLIVWWASRSNEGENRFGASPHGPAVSADTFA